MFSTRSRVNRTAAVTFALAGALGLSACQDSGPDTAPPTSAAPATEAESSAAPETSEESSSSSESSSESSTESSSSSSSSDSSGGSSDAKLTPWGTTLKMNEEGIVNEGSDDDPEPIAVTPTALEKAPDSVYSENPSLKKENGAVYYLKFKVRNVSSESIRASDLNGLFFHPEINASNQGKAKRLYGSTSACDTSSDEIAPGSSQDACTVYQIGGDPVSGNVVYAKGSEQPITWKK